MASDSSMDHLLVTLRDVAGAIPIVSALEVIAAHGAATSQALYDATRQSANAATVELATTASSAMQVLSGPPSGNGSGNGKDMKKLLRALKRCLEQHPGAPVVT